MKIYFQNKAVKLRHSILGLVCPECLFYRIAPCPFGTSTILDCDNKKFVDATFCQYDGQDLQDRCASPPYRVL
jgi:hypothetical protein